MRADDLLAAVFPDQAACAENLEGEIRIPDHPLVNETIDNCLHEAMDLDGLIAILQRMEEGTLRTVAVDTRRAVGFLAYEILECESLCRFWMTLRLKSVVHARGAVAAWATARGYPASGIGALDPAAIAEVAEQSWPVVRDADELHDALLTLIILPPLEGWRGSFDELLLAKRASIVGGHWVATERLDHAGDVSAILRGWADSIGPFTAAELAQRLSLPSSDVEIALAQLEGEGLILRGNFTGRDHEFCHRRILARIHRQTLGRLRREIEPVSSADFMRFLCRWQHLNPGAKLHGVDGLYQVLKQLEGYEISAAAWESTVLPGRIHKYDPEWLDRLCLAGEVMWGRLSPHPSLEALGSRKVRPTRVAPLGIFLREDAGRLLPAPGETQQSWSHAAKDVLAALEQRGASFFHDLVRATGQLASEVEDGLWELVAGGRVTADGFENLRALIDPKRRRGEGRGRMARPRHATGRWAILETGASGTDVEFYARVLLDRWGVVFRDVLARETLAPPWRSLLVVLRQWEARGEVRGGRFVAGFSGEQFARPEAVELLRELRRNGGQGEEMEIALADPLNLTGVILPGPRTSALAQGVLRLRDGVQQDEPASLPGISISA